jgi:hypothetical protein
MTDGGHLLVAGGIGGALTFAALVMLATQPAVGGALTKSRLQAFLWPLAFALCVLLGAAVAQRCAKAPSATEESP